MNYQLLQDITDKENNKKGKDQIDKSTLIDKILDNRSRYNND